MSMCHFKLSSVLENNAKLRNQSSKNGFTCKEWEGGNGIELNVFGPFIENY